MSVEKKISLKQWASFVVGALTIVGKLVIEIIELLPEKNA